MMAMEIAACAILLSVGIAVLVIIHICIAGRALRRGFNNSSLPVQTRSAIRVPRMGQEEMKELPCFDYKVEEKGGSNNNINGCDDAAVAVSAMEVECAVCLENFRAGERCRLLPNCKHSFHIQCIDSWLSKTAACPICRRDASLVKIGSSRDAAAAVHELL